MPSIHRSVSVVVLLICGTADAAIVTLSTEYHPLPSMGTIGLVVGDPSVTPPLYVSPLLGLHGTGVIEMNLDATGSGTAELTTSWITVEDVPLTTITLGALGSIDIELQGIQLNLRTGVINVVNNEYTVTRLTTGRADVRGGTLRATNPTGLFATYLPGGYFVDFGSSPLLSDFRFLQQPTTVTLDDGAGLFASTAELNVGDPFLISNVPLRASGLTIYVQYTVQAHLAAIPEVPSGVLVGVAAPLVFLVFHRRSRKSLVSKSLAP